MAKEWQVATDNGELVYTLKLDGNKGVLEVKEGPNAMGGTSWKVYHEGVELTGYGDVQHSINYCNELAEKLS